MEWMAYVIPAVAGCCWLYQEYLDYIEYRAREIERLERVFRANPELLRLPRPVLYLRYWMRRL